MAVVEGIFMTIGEGMTFKRVADKDHVNGFLHILPSIVESYSMYKEKGCFSFVHISLRGNEGQKQRL